MGALEVVFAYKGNKISVWTNRSKKFKNVLDILKKKLKIKWQTSCIYNGEKIDEEKTMEEIIVNNNSKINILVIDTNYITAEFNIQQEFEPIQIINTFGNYLEIRDNILIMIDGEIIPFLYEYRFNKKGKWVVEYYFLRNLTNINHMFEGCNKLISLNLVNFNTQNVTDMSWMFYGCSSLSNLDLSNFNTQNVKYMYNMFYGCSSLSNLDLSNFNTQNVTDMSFMFYGCSSLSNLDLSNFNTENVTDMRCMFDGCSSLSNLDLSNFNTQNVTDMSYMFSGCIPLFFEIIRKFK